MADKRNNKGPWKHEVQADRRKQAEARQAERDTRTPEQQIAHLDKYGFDATRERTRLLKQIEQNKDAEAKKTEKKQIKKG